MRPRATIAAVVAAAGMAAAASAQDSVSDLPGTGQGDGLNPWDAAQQCATYVVSLTPFESSAGARFAIAPLVKSSKNATDFFSSLVGAQSVSALDILSDGFNQPEYFIWDQPGFGVNLAETANGVPNLTPELVAPQAEGRVRQFSAMFGEFGTTDAESDYEAAIGAVVNYDEADPTRLYVTRYNAAINGANPTENRSSMGYGSIDADGNLYFRAEGFGVTGPNPITGNNIFRVGLAARDCDILNVIDNSGGADAATDWLLQNSGVTHSVPANLEASVAGRPVYIGGNFEDENVRESSPGVLTGDTTHIADPVDGTQRGVVSAYRRDVLDNGGVGTASVLQKFETDATNAVALWSVDADGVPVGSPVAFPLPTAGLTDPTTGFELSSNGEYDHYHSQVPFRGGVGQTDVGETLDGQPLFSGVVYTPQAIDNNPFNAIVVGRFDPSDPTGSVEYALAGYIALDANSGVAEGKPVLDGDGAVIGEMVDYFALSMDSNMPGPSVSGAAFDGAGNVWFIGVVDYNLDPEGEADLRTTLLRSVYTELDGGGFGYELEKVIAFGDVFTGANSATEYRIGPMTLVDNNSVNSGTFWSSNVKQEVAPTAQRGGLTPADAASTAGVVVSAGILYDVDGDGDFNFPGEMDPGSADEGYNVLLYIAPDTPTAPCPADLDGSGVVNATDLGILIAAWGSPTTNPAADLNADNNVNATDLGILIAAWGPCD